MHRTRPSREPFGRDFSLLLALRSFTGMPPPTLNEPILLFSVDPWKVAGFEIYGENFTDIGAVKGATWVDRRGYGGSVCEERPA